MKAIYALFNNPDSAQQAVDDLRREGVPDNSITVITSQPYEEYEFSHRYKPTWLFWIAAGGGTFGLLFALSLTYFTATAWPIPTGGMPIVAWWPNIIVIFELTMLGAILATVFSLFITTGLPTKQRPIYDAEVSRGKIMVAVEGPKEHEISRLERTLRVSGIEDVKTVP